MKVYVLNPIHPMGLDILDRHTELVRWDDPRAAGWHDDAEGLVVRGNIPVTADDLARARKLKAVSKHGTGVNNIDLEAARKHGVTVMNTPGINAEAVAELSMALALATSRRVAQIDRMLRAGEKVAREDVDGSKGGGCHGFEGKVLGVVGIGSIGRRVAGKWRRAFDMTVLGYDPHAPAEAWEDFEGESVARLDHMLGRVDLLSVHVPLTDETRTLIGARELAMMKPTAVLVSAARGGVVDEKALYEALASGRLFGAALDVFEVEPPAAEHPLFTIPGFVGSPHVGGGTVESRERNGVAVAEQLIEFLSGGKARNVVT
jgi:D-3-phosphoglycerate dehydrogenase / 2-oxoglutarate reductase